MNKGELEYDAIIGLEVHAQLATKTKIWCGCEVNPNALENSRVCEICSGHPGTLPVLNNRVVEYAVKMGLGTGCKINNLSYFDRKHYFYPDLPKGYQITQLDIPIAQDGHIVIKDDLGADKRINIQRIQIEEDSGKSSYCEEGLLVNLNRAGTPLIEIVSRPDMRSSNEAVGYLKKLYSILTNLEICHGQLQDGNFRCDVNISLSLKGQETCGVRTEIKNLNSFRHVEKAIESEVLRQSQILESGKEVIQQTLGFDGETMQLRILRSKSDTQDYRYFREPDLIPIIVSEREKTQWEEELPELPDSKRARFMSEYGLSLYDAEILSNHRYLATFFENAAKLFKGEAKKVANWIIVEHLRLLHEFNVKVEETPVLPYDLATLLNAVHDERISGRQAKDVFQKMFVEKKGADLVLSELGFVQISDESILAEIIQKMIDENPILVEQYLSGKERVFGFFVGLVMKSTEGHANPQLTNLLIKKFLENKKYKD